LVASYSEDECNSGGLEHICATKSSQVLYTGSLDKIIFCVQEDDDVVKGCPKLLWYYVYWDQHLYLPSCTT